MWSEESEEVILVELTVGDESNFSNDQVESKEARYNRELIPGLLGKGWKALARLFTVSQVIFDPLLPKWEGGSRQFTVEIICRGLWHYIHILPVRLNYFSVTKKAVI